MHQGVLDRKKEQHTSPYYCKHIPCVSVRWNEVIDLLLYVQFPSFQHLWERAGLVHCMHTINYSHKYGVLSVAIGMFTGEIMSH